ncbi:glycosyltransferase family 2 protein [Algirhabdus cladophorae]|uniref:glycosyltransferase family 2 protein n=1 Tax=Algirhabdus cladophorae TaxID=3377108 RepID=UPI003B8460AE
MSSAPKWSVVATVDEAPELTVAFVAYHLDLGAHEVFIFLDRSDDPVAAVLAQMDRCYVVACDGDHWVRAGKAQRPYQHTHRQSTNANLAFAQSTADWLFHIDADEYLYPMGDWLDEMARVPKGHYLRVFNVERVRLAANPEPEHLFEGPFLRKLDAQESQLLGAEAQFYHEGFSGHSVGKSAAPVGAKMRLSIHRPRLTKGPRPRPTPPKRVARAVTLLHFEDITPLAWTFKRVRRMIRNAGSDKPLKSSGHRQAQIDWLAAHAPTGAEAMAFYRRLCVIEADRATALRQIDALYDLELDVQGALDRVCPQLKVDISPARLDAWLWATKGDMLAQYGFKKGAL